MDISALSNTPAVSRVGKNTASSRRNNTRHSASEEGYSNAYQAADKNAGIWEELAKKFDVRNASFDELCDISSQLYLAGQISLFDHVILIFEPEESPQTVSYDICLTEADADGKRNWLREYEARVARDLKAGNTLGYKVNKNILSILERLQQSRKASE